MNYEIYKTQLGMEEFFKKWDNESYTQLTEELKKQIYNKYLMKCVVFKRDEFKCQNVKCVTPESDLTLHHVKWKKNGGVDKVRNGVTVCHSCHKAFHRAKKSLVFTNSILLPTHISGNTFKLVKPETVDWKAVKSKMKDLRKNLKRYCGLKLTLEQVAMLMRWLEIQYEEE